MSDNFTHLPESLYNVKQLIWSLIEEEEEEQNIKGDSSSSHSSLVISYCNEKSAYRIISGHALLREAREEERISINARFVSSKELNLFSTCDHVDREKTDDDTSL